MRYFEHDNVIFAGKEYPELGGHPLVRHYLVGGKWADCTSKEGLDAAVYGNPMTEQEAKDFQGDAGWPAEAPPV